MNFLQLYEVMDIIQNAINRKLHISKDESLNEQTWDQFENEAKHKKVFLFGIGKCGSLFFEKYDNWIKLERAIDNDTLKQGKRLIEVRNDLFVSRNKNVVISSIECLKHYNKEEIVVLITIINGYEEVISQLKQAGIDYYYVALIMEANMREQRPENSCFILKGKAFRKRYIEKCCDIPIEKKKIVFYSFGTYSDHGKYIAEALQCLRTDLDLVWLIKDENVKVPDRVRTVRMSNWEEYVYEMETAHIWIWNVMIPDFIVKREEQIYIQTKHWASVTLKKFYLDASTITDVTTDVLLWKHNGENIDYMITGSDFDTESCRRGFNFHKDVFQVGSPRSDAMFQHEIMKKRICQYFALEADSRILVYAPTYRYKKGVEGHIAEIREIDINYYKLKEVLTEKFSGEWYIMLRLHPGHENDVEKIALPGFVIDASKYEDGQEIVSACDILVSDYSSIMFEPAFVKKPVFLYAQDKDAYINNEYDLLLDYASLPFPIAENDTELIDNIKKFDTEQYKNNVTTFLEKYGVHEDGHASERAAKLINSLLN